MTSTFTPPVSAHFHADVRSRRRVFKQGTGRTRVGLVLRRVGRDWLGVIGGAGEHLGAVALAQRHGGRGVRVRTITATGHRDTVLARSMAAAVCRASGQRGLIVAGIHLDRIRRSEITAILANAKRVEARVARWLRQGRR